MISKEMLALGSNRSVIREITEFGKMRAEKVGAENVYDFSIGNPSVPAPQKVKDTLIDILTNEPAINIHSYASAIGNNDTRDAIANDLNNRFGTDYSRNNLLITSGASSALTYTFRAIISDSNSEIIVIAPYFTEYEVFIKSNGGKLVLIPADMKHFQIDFDYLEKSINIHTAGIVINSPNNPSGVIYSEKTILKLSDLLAEKSKEFGHPIYIISDEPYRELVYTQEKVPFTANYYNNTIVCYSYSKSLSLPGERIGYVLIPNKVENMQEMYNAIVGASRSCGFICASSLFQKVIARCADVSPDISSYKKNREFLYSALKEIGYECADPSGAFYLFVKAPNGDADKFGEIAKSVNLLVVPGADFGCASHFRVAYCVDYDMIVRSIPAFKKAYDLAVKA